MAFAAVVGSPAFEKAVADPERAAAAAAEKPQAQQRAADVAIPHVKVQKAPVIVESDSESDSE